MAMAAYGTADIRAVAPESGEDRDISRRIDLVREAMLGDMRIIEQRNRTYLRWYSPPYNEKLGTHDAWTTPLKLEQVGLTRANFPVSRAVVDIWSSLEASKPATLRAEPERMMPPLPSLDEGEELRRTIAYGAVRKVEQLKSSIRGSTVRNWMRRDQMALHNWTATRRKNLYGFSWVKVWPDRFERRPRSWPIRNGTTVYPIWSSRDPGEMEAVLYVYQKNARAADVEFNLGLNIRADGALDFGNHPEYRELNDTWYDSSRTMLWVEEFWWIDRTYDSEGRETDSVVHCATRIMGRILRVRHYRGWRYIPFVYYENADERDAYGFSDIAGVIDVNDEFNRRLSQEGDIIGMYSAPRFQLLNSFANRKVDMPGPFELISLQDQEKIEQILTRIDTFPTQQHFTILIDLLHRVSGLPPIVWGLIANAQTSGRALTASWKATETRLAPKIMRDEMTLNGWLNRIVNFAEVYDWQEAKIMFRARDGSPFRDFRWDWPPMEPRDFQEVTMNEITKRDAGGQSTIGMMRAWGDEAAEDTLEEYLAEALNPLLHPDKVTSFYLAERAKLDNIAYAQQLGQQVAGPTNVGTVQQAVGAARQAQQAQPTPQVPAEAGTMVAPPTQPGQPGNAAEAIQPTAGPLPGPGGQLSSGQLLRNGQLSNQLLLTRKMS